jgi:hypothetical protein
VRIHVEQYTLPSESFLSAPAAKRRCMYMYGFWNKWFLLYLENALLDRAAGSLQGDVRHFSGSAHDEDLHGLRHLATRQHRCVQHFPTLEQK